MEKDSKPQTYKNFEQLTKRLIEVPKSELDKQVQRYEGKKRRRKRRPKGSGGA